MKRSSEHIKGKKKWFTSKNLGVVDKLEFTTEVVKGQKYESGLL